LLVRTSRAIVVSGSGAAKVTEVYVTDTWILLQLARLRHKNRSHFRRAFNGYARGSKPRIVALFHLQPGHAEAGRLEVVIDLFAHRAEVFARTYHCQSRTGATTIGDRRAIHTGTPQEQVEYTHVGLLLAKVGAA
jgi:AraC-like DNA-binding protein